METNSELVTDYISYDFKSRSISKISKEKKDFYIQCIKNHLNYSLDEYKLRDLTHMDETLFAFSEESLKQENKNFLVITLTNLIEMIEESDNYDYLKTQKIKLNDIEKGKGIFNISYKEICVIVNFIISLLKTKISSKKQKEKFYSSFYFGGEVPNYDVEVGGITLKQLKNQLDSVKQINICISDKNANFNEVKNRYEINKFAIELFFMFFGAFFKNVLLLNLDLNIYEINNYFNKESNPYNINENIIIKLCKTCERIFIGNLIILKNLSKFQGVNKLSFALFDSYYVEFYQILTNKINKIFNQNETTPNSINIKSNNNSKDDNIQTMISSFINKIIFFDFLFQEEIRPYFEFNFEINSLDPFLFLKMNLLMHKYTGIINTSINFFKLDNINMRKILLNGYYFHRYLQQKDKDISNPTIKFIPNIVSNLFENDYKIYYNHINNINDYNNKLLLRDEEILNELFPHFNYNLNLLLFVLIQKFKSDKNLQNSISLNFQTNNNGILDIHSYNNYNCAILSFLFNFFYELECNINLESICSLEIYLDDLCDKKEYIIKYIFDKFRKNNPFDFKKINLTRMVLDIPNITLILPFENFPYKGLQQLTLKNLSYNDLGNIANALSQKKQKFEKLTTLDIGVGFMLEDYKKFLRVILSKNICKKLTNLSLEIPCFITNEDIVDMLSSIKKNKNTNTTYFLKISNEELNKNLGKEKYFATVYNFKESIKKESYRKNLITNITCADNKIIEIKMKTLSKDQIINPILNLLFCFERKLSKNNKKLFDDTNKAKIFENIFYYMGNFSNNEKKINIEVI